MQLQLLLLVSKHSMQLPALMCTTATQPKWLALLNRSDSASHASARALAALESPPSSTYRSVSSPCSSGVCATSCTFKSAHRLQRTTFPSEPAYQCAPLRFAEALNPFRESKVLRRPQDRGAHYKFCHLHSNVSARWRQGGLALT